MSLTYLTTHALSEKIKYNARTMSCYSNSLARSNVGD